MSQEAGSAQEKALVGMKQLSFYSYTPATDSTDRKGTATLTEGGEVVLDPPDLCEIVDVPLWAGGGWLTPEDGAVYVGALYYHLGDAGYFWAEPSADSEPIQKIDAEPWRHLDRA